MNHPNEFMIAHSLHRRSLHAITLGLHATCIISKSKPQPPGGPGRPTGAGERFFGDFTQSSQVLQHPGQGKPEFLVPGNQETTRPPGNSGKRKEITRKLP
jgi:hypothetical protein